MARVKNLPPVGCSKCGAARGQLCTTVGKPWNVYFGRTDGKLFVHRARIAAARYELLFVLLVYRRWSVA